MALPPHAPADDEAPIRLWRDGAVAHLRFNRPRQLNAMDLAGARALHEACRRIADTVAEDMTLRVVRLSGEGRAFLAGGDIAAMAEDPALGASALIPEVHGALTLLNGLRTPVLAEVQGAVAGAGLGVLMACDLVVAAEGTRFTIGFTAIGASADSSTTWGLPRVMGLRQALRFALLGETLDVADAHRLGLVSEVVTASQLGRTADEWCQRLADGAPLALGAVKRLLRGSLDRSLPEQLAAEAEAFRDCAATEDFREGLAAFLAKRPPRFQGR